MNCKIGWNHVSQGDLRWRELRLMNPDHSLGVRLTLVFQETCRRRGQWKLAVEVLNTPFIHAWGCFDEADQPIRYYLDEAAALAEGVRIARVLLNDFPSRQFNAEL